MKLTLDVLQIVFSAIAAVLWFLSAIKGTRYKLTRDPHSKVDRQLAEQSYFSGLAAVATGIAVIFQAVLVFFPN